MPDIMLLPVIADIFEITIDELYGKSKNGMRQTHSFEDIVEKSFEALLVSMQLVWHRNVPDVDRFESIEGGVINTKAFLEEHPDSQSAIYSMTKGAVYANRDICLIFRMDAKEAWKLLSNDDGASMLSVVADDAVRKIIMHLIENKGVSFTVSSIAAKYGLSEETAKNALDQMTKYNLTILSSVDMGEETISIYQPYLDNKLLFIFSILLLAERLPLIWNIIEGIVAVPIFGISKNFACILKKTWWGEPTMSFIIQSYKSAFDITPMKSAAIFGSN